MLGSKFVTGNVRINYCEIRECMLIEHRALRKGVSWSLFVVCTLVVRLGCKLVKDAAFNATARLWVLEIRLRKEQSFVMRVNEITFARVPWKFLTFLKVENAFANFVFCFAECAIWYPGLIDRDFVYCAVGTGPSNIIHVKFSLQMVNWCLTF